MKILACLVAIALIGCAPADREATPAVSPETELRAALQQLVAGGRAGGSTHTWFSPATSHAIKHVTLDDAGRATIDFIDLAPIIPNASSSAGSTMLLEELNATVFSVPAVRAVEYRMEGSCERFWNWLQYDCQVVPRP